MKRLFALIGALVLFGAIVAGVLYVQWNNAVPIFAMAINYVRYLSAPAGSMTTEVAASEGGAAPSTPASTTPAASPGATPGPEEVQGAKEGDWPSYNKTLTSNRFSPLSQINKDNVGNLKVLCTYDTGQYTGFTRRFDRGERCPDRNDGIRYFLHRSGELPPELAHPRRLLTGNAAGRQSRRGLHGWPIISRHPGRPRPGL